MPRHGDNIRRRTDGRWEGRYRCMDKENTRRYKSVYGKTYTEVKERLAEIQVQEKLQLKEKNTGDNNMDLSFCETAEKWLLFISRTRKYSTYMKYLKVYECHIREGLENSCISDITSSFVNEKLFSSKDNDISCSMKHSILAVTNQVLGYANEVYGCPVAKLPNRRPKDTGKKISIINHTEQEVLFRYLYEDLDTSKAGIILCLSTGLRLGEICSLKWEDIDLKQKLIHVNRTVQRIAVDGESSRTRLMETPPKSPFSIREIPISELTIQLLGRVRHEGEYVMCGNKPMEPRTYQNHFKKYLKELGMKDYNFHVLRHTFATNCIDNGMDVKSLSEILGHSDVQITLNRYVHPTMDTKRKHISALSSIYGQYCGQKE